MSDKEKDKRLWRRAAQGDEAAFLQLYREHRDPIFRFAYRMVGSVEVAEDVAHECFLSLITGGDRFDPAHASLRTYLFAAARNLAFKHLRKTDCELAVETMPEHPRLSCAEAPLHKLLNDEMVGQVRAAISSLPPLQREVIILFEYEELSLAEIAAIVAADVGTIKSRLYRARERLRKSLAPYFKSQPALATTKR